jgi:hypothetical protein
LNSHETEKPLLFLDIDGVLSPFDAEQYPREYKRIKNSLRHLYLAKIHKDWILELANDFEIIWATGWGDKANSVIGYKLGIGSFPLLSFQNWHLKWKAIR